MAAPKQFYSVLTIVACIIIWRSSIVGATWCVARNNAIASALQPQLDYACGHGADCSGIQPGGICFNPNNIYNHASYAFDSYYVRMGRAPGSCYFGGTAVIAVTDPSYGRCRYPSSLKRNGEGTNTTSSKLQSSQNMRKLGHSIEHDNQTN
ncbi:PREDICTED: PLASMODESMATA CALLOSE-BINDING PROTEIN 2-like isoform X2 [Lupinus angustifolius]|uniref:PLASMODESMATA CALLOSE-BINDING PROTEIN 2-like isoform X2 n=1 Tax=Lupinus angustifolius TaxID=3871 RepID=UPI00092F3007|nr:PREDICTED: PLASMODESMATA CALLOSE-BINDING PROTEIN 2-like isoform X2 [Lupinus angustifolius]